MTHPVLELATFLQAQWLAALASIRATHEARLAIKARLTDLRGEHGGYMVSDWETRVSLKSLFGSFADEIERAMSEELQRIGFPANVSSTDFDGFGNPPRYHDAPERDLDAFYLRELAHAETRSLLILAEQMVAQFSPERARLAALEEAACRVYNYFAGPSWKPRQVQINERRGKKVLSHALYCDSCSPWRMNSSGLHELRDVLQAMRLLLSDVQLEHAVWMRDNYHLYRLMGDGSFTSRMTIPMGLGLSLLFFKDKLEFHFAPDILDQLQASIATYRMLAEAA